MPGPELAAGSLVAGCYTIASRLGASARATTYRATAAAGRDVVLKLYDPALDADALAALRRSASVATGVPRASVLEVIEVGQDGPTGAVFVATEPSARPSLAGLVEICPLAPAEAATFARNLAHALGEAHERGLAHGALRPTNIFVGPPPALEVRLGDFGAPPRAPWMAPEQEAGPATGASDVFSAALVVFFALTRRSYFCGASEADVEAWRQEARGPLTPASARAAALGIALDTAWDTAFARALRPEPEGRFATIGGLAEAFGRASRGEPPAPDASAPAASPSIPAAPPARSLRTWLIAGVGGVAALALAAVAVARCGASTHPTESSPATSASTAVPAAAAPPSAPLTPAPTPSPARAPSATPTTSDAPAPAAPSAAPITTPRVQPWESMLVVICHPACDSVFVDGHPVAHAEQGKVLPAGVHMVGANLAHHPSKVQPILVRRGHVERFDATF